MEISYPLNPICVLGVVTLVHPRHNLLRILLIVPSPPYQHVPGQYSPQNSGAQVSPEIAGYQQQVANYQQYIGQLQQQAAALQQQVSGYQQRIEALQRELLAIEETSEFQSFGFYQAHYGFDLSEKYTQQLKINRDQQKALIKNGQATYCGREWAVDGSLQKGKEAVKQHSKLMLRAFNGECDAAIAKTKYNNVTRLEKRVEKSCEAINKLGHAKLIYITRPYYDLKLAELRLVHEHREKVQEEKEEQQRIKEQMREEMKAQKEIEKATANAEKEEALHQKALDKARKELAESTDKQHEKLEALVTKLERELSEAIDRKAKAIARAQLTKSGHVYVLSNIGSFGESFYKIGMTRRFEPLDRVHELGGASVPFRFDVHAMIYSENATALEHKLHKEFAEKRVNRVNHRREYFRVSLNEIRQAVAKHHGIVTFVTEPIAEEYRKTLAMEQEFGRTQTNQAG